MKIEDKKKLATKICWRVFLALFIAFLALYVSQATGYYEYEQHQKVVLTNEKIKQFEQDVADGKNIDIQDYMESKTPNYKTKISSFGLQLSKELGSVVQSGLEATFEFLNGIMSE